MQRAPELSIVVPAYNEEQRIEPTLIDLDRFLSDYGVSYEIVVVDDGSEDGTVGLVGKLRRKMPALRCIATRPNRGKGHAVRVGMLAARGAICLMTDADGSTPAEEIPTLVEAIRRGETDIAIGSRYTGDANCEKKQPFYRRWWSRLANRVVQATLVPGIRDTQCGFKAFSAEAAKRVFELTRIDGWAFDLEALALANRLSFTVVELGVNWADDPRSWISPVKDALRVIRELISIRLNLRRGVYGQLRPASSCERAQ